MNLFGVFLTIGLTLLVLAITLYWVIPWLMQRDCEFELNDRDFSPDLNKEVVYEYNPETDNFERKEF